VFQTEADLVLGIHPTTIAQSFQKAAAKAVEYLEEMSIPVDLNDRESLLKAAGTSLNSKVRIAPLV
jgi:T-complex protein 1 subunit delta